VSNTQEMLRDQQVHSQSREQRELARSFHKCRDSLVQSSFFIDGRNLSLFIGKKKLRNLTDIEEEVLSCKTTFSFSMACVVDAR